MTTPRTSRRIIPHAIETPTIVEFLLDETGSMADHKAGTLSGFNVYLDEQRAQGGTCLLSLTKFDTTGLKTPYTDIDVRFAPHLSEHTFVPGMMTNLRDALGQRVRALEERIASFTVKPNVLFAVLTDGVDNASTEYSDRQISDMIKARESEGWTFVYLGSDANALDRAARMGFQPGNTMKFDTSRIHETMADLSRSTTAYRASGKTEQFFAAL